MGPRRTENHVFWLKFHSCTDSDRRRFGHAINATSHVARLSLAALASARLQLVPLLSSWCGIGAVHMGGLGSVYFLDKDKTGVSRHGELAGGSNTQLYCSKLYGSQFNHLAKSTILHRSIVVQLDSLALGVGAKVCIISLSLSLHIDMYSSLSTISVSRVALPRYTPPKLAHQAQ
jgi:hypothetical protein